MWASMLHLFIGNALIGILESCLLFLLFRSSIRRSVLILISANYVSAFGGAALLGMYVDTSPDIMIQNIQIWFRILAVSAFVLTLIIEFPFFMFSLAPKERSVRKGILATCIIHGMSYGLLYFWYLGASGTSLMTELEVVSADQLRPTAPYALCYLSVDGKNVLQQDLNQTGSATEIADVEASHLDDRLFTRIGETSAFDLILFHGSDVRGEEHEERIIEAFAENVSLEPSDQFDPQSEVKGSWMNFGYVPRFSDESNWRFNTGFWPVEGLQGYNKSTGMHIHYSLELPFIAWVTRNAVHLEGDYVVMQLGTDQICILHPETKQIALLGRGRGPVVVIPTERQHQVP